jgi:CRP/FNR family transcriptional regulator, cyclic AMP receptor protein
MAAESLFMNAPDPVDVPAGQVIYSDGDAGSHMYGIIEGSVALTKGSTVIAVLGPDDVFGERALIDHLPRNVTAVATSDSKLAQIDRRLFLFLVHESPTFAIGIMGALASRLRAYDEMVAAGAETAQSSAES